MFTPLPRLVLLALLAPLSACGADGPDGFDAPESGRDAVVLTAQQSARVDEGAAEYADYVRAEAGYQRLTGTERAEYADRLLADLTTLKGEVADADYTGEQIANGAKELLDEVANGKVTGEPPPRPASPAARTAR